MNISRRLIAIISVILVLIIIGIILFLTLGRKKTVAPVAVKKTIPLITNNTQQKNGQVVSSTPPTVVEVAQFDATQLAANFAERFGTFSNQAGMQNLKDAEAFMTANLRAWAEKSIAAAAKIKNNITAYQGTITKAVSTDVKSSNTTSADVTVHCQRKSGDKVAYQDLAVKLVKTGDNWLVDQAVWQK